MTVPGPVAEPGGEDRAAAERAELAQLRTEVARLRATATGRGHRRWRPMFAGTLIALAALLAPLALVARWAHAEVSDTETYVATVAPLAVNPAVQQAMTDRLTAQVLTRVDVPALVRQAVSALAGEGLPAPVAGSLNALATPLADGIQSFVHDAVSRLVHSRQFVAAWVTANRLAHQELVGALTGTQDGTVRVEGDAVTVNLAPIVASVKQDLVDRGFGLAARIPEVETSFVIFQSAQVHRVQRGFRLLGALAIWLPLAALALAGGGIYLARDRRRALIGAALGIAGGMLLLGVVLALVRPAYLGALPAEVSRGAAAAVFDALTRPMRLSLRTVAAAALVVAAGAALLGPAAAARRIRAVVVALTGRLRGSAEHAGLRTGRAGEWVYAHRGPLRAGLAAIAVLVFLASDRPSAATVFGLAAGLIAALGVLELLAAPPPGPAGRHG